MELGVRCTNSMPHRARTLVKNMLSGRRSPQMACASVQTRKPGGGLGTISPSPGSHHAVESTWPRSISRDIRLFTWGLTVVELKAMVTRRLGSKRGTKGKKGEKIARKTKRREHN